MKNFTLIIGLILMSFAGYAQNCPTNVFTFFAPYFNGNPTMFLISDNQDLQNAKYQVFCSGQQIAQGCLEIKGLNGQPGISAVSVPVCGAGYSGYTFKLVFSQGTCGSGNPECDTIFENRDPSGGPLPVVLGKFGIIRRSSGVELRWETEQEINSSHFEIQRSIGIKGFQTIERINAQGSSSVIKNYAYVDKDNTSKDVSFYRIKMVDLDGTFAYTGIKTVRGTGVAAEFKVFPNPTNAHATIQINDLNEPVTITVMDHSGRLVKTLSLKNTNEVKLNNLQKGTYIIRMIGDETGTTTVRQLSVLK